MSTPSVLRDFGFVTPEPTRRQRLHAIQEQLASLDQLMQDGDRDRAVAAVCQRALESVAATLVTADAHDAELQALKETLSGAAVDVQTLADAVTTLNQRLQTLIDRQTVNAATEYDVLMQLLAQLEG